MAKLKVAHYVQLHKLVQEEFSASGKNDQEFAAYAAAKMDLPITHWHVLECRKTYGIPSLKAVNAQPETIAQRLAALEKAMADMVAWRANLEGPVKVAGK